jgi:uncharacterized membrane protein
MMGWTMILGWILLLAFIAGLVALLVWAVRRSSASSQADQAAEPSSETLKILKLRYAQGEIDSEQFEKMKQQLDED